MKNLKKQKVKSNIDKTQSLPVKTHVTIPTDSSSSYKSSDELNLIKKSSDDFNRKTLLILLCIMGITLFFVVRMFIIPVILALCFTTLFYPMYSYFLKFTRNNRVLSSIMCCLVLFFGLLIPLSLLIQLIANEFIGFYNSAEPLVKDLIARGDQSSIAKFFQHPLLTSVISIKIDWHSVALSALKTAGGFGTTIINKTSSGIFSLILTFAIMFFTMFYLFIDGDKLLLKLKFLSPLREEYDELLFKRFLMISRATIRGTILIGLAQGLLGGLTFLAVGIKSWLLWGFVMVMFSLIPFTGAWMVMIPAALFQLIYGHSWKAGIIAVMCILVVSSIDNVLRPRLVGTEAKMHDLMVFFSTLGGISVFGLMGFIIGPVVAALFIALLDMYGIEYNNVLSHSEKK